MVYVVIYLITGFGINLFMSAGNDASFKSKFLTAVVLAPMAPLALINIILEKMQVLWFVFVVKVMDFPIDQDLFR
jgi:hypothetical protein